MAVDHWLETKYVYPPSDDWMNMRGLQIELEKQETAGDSP